MKTASRFFCFITLMVGSSLPGLHLSCQYILESPYVWGVDAFRVMSRRWTMRIEEVFPELPKVQRLKVFRYDMTGKTVDFPIWLHSLQGLANRDEPELYLIRTSRPGGVGVTYEDHWLDYYKQRFAIPTEDIADLDAVMERYGHFAKGYVLYDNEDVIQTQNLATTRAGLESVLPIAPDQEALMQRYGIPKVDDLRGRFKDNWEAAEWAIDNLWPNCWRRLHGNFCVHRPNQYAYGCQLQEFIVRNKGIALDLPCTRFLRRPFELYWKMMETAEAPGVKMGWHCACEQEKEYVIEAARNGFFVLCSHNSPNLTIHGGIGDPDKAYRQPLPEPEECAAEKGKVYVCFYNSDGDATWAMNNLHSGNWTEPARGSFQFGWGFLPLMVRMMPGMYQYYQETKTDADCFWGPSSGAAYTYSHAWPEHLRDYYLTESRRLLDQTGQNGCNMVNWNLRDNWREVEIDEAILREQTLLGSGPGLVCGLGGSPYAKSYPQGPIPKLHSVHIANAGTDNVDDIVKFAKECPTRPLFMFLFAQIAPGVWETLDSQMKEFSKHPEIEIQSMDRFFLTLQDAVKKDMVGEELYELTDELAETWLKAPGRHRLPICERLCAELADVAAASYEERARHIGSAGWTDLVSKEVEQVGADREKFLKEFKDRFIVPLDEDANALLYVAFTTIWTLVRAALEAQGVYANHRDQCMEDFKRLCGGVVDTAPFEAVFDAWENWDAGAPSVEQMAEWCRAVAKEAGTLVDTYGPEESEEDFTGWPPRTI